jgi:putative hydrolase of the HAD superfamily
VIEEIIEIGQHMLTEPVHVLPHVPEVLAAVSGAVRTVMITKGDLVHQTRKVSTSGLEHHFTDVEILLEKNPETYAKILTRFNVRPERFLMVGNSVKSDILPVLALGAHAVHVPYHLTWVLERVDQHDEEFTELDSIADLPNWLGLLSAPTS